jgi:hypothetical protein
MHASCGASQNLATACGPIRNSLGTASQLQPSAGLSSAWSLQQSTIPVLHAEDQRRMCDMAWAESFYSANIPFAAARSVSFKKAVKMTSEMRSSYLPPSYHDKRKRLLIETKHKIKGSNCRENKDVHKNIRCDTCRGWLEFSQQPPSFKYDVCLSGWRGVLGGY